MKYTTKKIATLGILAALALIISFLESLMPPIFGAIPFAKLGLANVVILFTLVLFGWKEGLIILLFKCGFSAIFSGNPMMIVYSLSGSIPAFIVMWLLLLIRKNSITAIGGIGAIFHNIGQVCMAAIITKTSSVFYFLPHLLIFGILAGCITGFFAHILLKRAIPKSLLNN